MRNAAGRPLAQHTLAYAARPLAQHVPPRTRALARTPPRSASSPRRKRRRKKSRRTGDFSLQRGCGVAVAPPPEQRLRASHTLRLGNNNPGEASGVHPRACGRDKDRVTQGGSGRAGPRPRAGSDAGPQLSRVTRPWSGLGSARDILGNEGQVRSQAGLGQLPTPRGHPPQLWSRCPPCPCSSPRAPGQEGCRPPLPLPSLATPSGPATAQSHCASLTSFSGLGSSFSSSFRDPSRAAQGSGEAPSELLSTPAPASPSSWGASRLPWGASPTPA